MTAAGGKGLGEGAPTHGLAQRAGRPSGGGAAGGGCGAAANGPRCAGARRRRPNAREILVEPFPMREKNRKSLTRCPWLHLGRASTPLGRRIAHSGPFAAILSRTQAPSPGNRLEPAHWTAFSAEATRRTPFSARRPVPPGPSPQGAPRPRNDPSPSVATVRRIPTTRSRILTDN